MPPDGKHERPILKSDLLENALVRGRDWCKLLDAPVLTLDVTCRWQAWKRRPMRPTASSTRESASNPEVRIFFFFFFTLVTGPRRSLSLKLSDTRVYEPQIRARLETTETRMHADGKHESEGQGGEQPRQTRPQPEGARLATIYDRFTAIYERVRISISICDRVTYINICIRTSYIYRYLASMKAKAKATNSLVKHGPNRKVLSHPARTAIYERVCHVYQYLIYICVTIKIWFMFSVKHGPNRKVSFLTLPLPLNATGFLVNYS